jgi:hypothetical protein
MKCKLLRETLALVMILTMPRHADLHDVRDEQKFHVVMDSKTQEEDVE